MPANEHELVTRLKQGEDAAFELLVRDYGRKMYAVARHLLMSEDDAQECLQRAFIQVFEHIEQFRSEASLATWLHRITANSALMLLRANKRQATDSFDDFQQHYNEYGERTLFADSSGRSIEQQLIHQESGNNIKKLIAQLPEKYCNVLLLRDIQELSTRDSAEILGLTETAVKTQLHRARLLLAALLQQQTQ